MFEIGNEVYYERNGQLGSVIGVDNHLVRIEFESGDKQWVSEYDILFRDTAEFLFEELGVESATDY